MFSLVARRPRWRVQSDREPVRSRVRRISCRQQNQEEPLIGGALQRVLVLGKEPAHASATSPSQSIGQCGARPR